MAGNTNHLPTPRFPGKIPGDKGCVRAVIHPFGLNDVWLVRRLQNSGVALAIEYVLTQRYQPLWTALTAPWPWAGKGVATYVFEPELAAPQVAGFVQLLKRAARPEADVLYVAPALGTAEGDSLQRALITTWRLMLSQCCAAAASHGLQRIFVSVPDGCPEQASLREAGFSLYTRESIYRLAAAPASVTSAPGVRRQGPQDGWALQRLYVRNTPRLVQQAEGATSGEVGSWWEPDSWQGIVWEPAGEVRGAAQAHLGQTGHWLRVWGSGDLQPRELRTLLEQALGLIRSADSARRALPVYVTVREYEMSLSSALIGFGFAPFMDRMRFVKHTLAVARLPAAVPAVGREIWQEAPVQSRAE